MRGLRRDCLGILDTKGVKKEKGVPRRERHGKEGEVENFKMRAKWYFCREVGYRDQYQFRFLSMKPLNTGNGPHGPFKHFLF